MNAHQVIPKLATISWWLSRFRYATVTFACKSLFLQVDFSSSSVLNCSLKGFVSVQGNDQWGRINADMSEDVSHVFCQRDWLRHLARFALEASRSWQTSGKHLQSTHSTGKLSLYDLSFLTISFDCKSLEALRRRRCCTGNDRASLRGETSHDWRANVPVCKCHFLPPIDQN